MFLITGRTLVWVRSLCRRLKRASFQERCHHRERCHPEEGASPRGTVRGWIPPLQATGTPQAQTPQVFLFSLHRILLIAISSLTPASPPFGMASLEPKTN